MKRERDHRYDDDFLAYKRIVTERKTRKVVIYECRAETLALIGISSL